MKRCVECRDPHPEPEQVGKQRRAKWGAAEESEAFVTRPLQNQERHELKDCKNKKAQEKQSAGESWPKLPVPKV